MSTSYQEGKVKNTNLLTLSLDKTKSCFQKGFNGGVFNTLPYSNEAGSTFDNKVYPTILCIRSLIKFMKNASFCFVTIAVIIMHAIHS